jgi:Arc/MetJ-type ribon-helix-helix transcriptional regulator
MAYQFPPDVKKLVDEQMALGGYNNEDDVLRHALGVLGQFAYSSEEVSNEYQQTVSAVREGAEDVEAGRVRSLREFIREARSTQSRDND